MLRNNQSSTHYLQLQLKDSGINNKAVGAKLWLHQGNTTQYLQLMPTRGFVSASDTRAHFGLGDKNTIDSLVIRWPAGEMQVLKNLVADSLYIIYKNTGNIAAPQKTMVASALLYNITAQSGIGYSHSENTFNDYNRQYLLPHKLSTRGPGIAVADANGDGLQDFYICGGTAQAGAVYLQQANGTFSRKLQPALEKK